jgi:tetratricopeptide (TPR) repeat protein
MYRSIFTLTIFLVFTLPLFAQKDRKSIIEVLRGTPNKNAYADRIKEVSREIEMTPDVPILYLYRAEYYSWRGDEANTLADVRKALSLIPDETNSLSPENANILERAARVLYYANQFDEGLKIADKLFSKDKSCIYLAHRIRYLERFGQHDYLGTISDILAINEIFAEADDDGRLYADKDGNDIRPESILSVTLDHLQDDPDIYSYYDRLFRILEERGRGGLTNGTSIQLFLLKINLYVNQARLYENKLSQSEIDVYWAKFAADKGLSTRAMVYQKLGKYDDAIKDLTSVIESDRTDNLSNFIQRGDLNILAGHLNEALSDYESAKRPEDGTTMNMDSNIEKVKRMIAKGSPK